MRYQKEAKLGFSILVYVLAWGSIVYYLDFFTGFYVPKTVDQGVEWPWIIALIWDLLLLLGLGLLLEMTRKADFQAQIPAGLDRSFQLLMYVLALVFLVSLWRPINGVIYDLRDHAMATVFSGCYYWGWWMCLTATFLIDHWSRFGVRQPLNLLSKPESMRATALKTPLLYLLVRHPVYLGMIIFHFSTPYMSIGRLLLAVGITYFLLRQIELDETQLLKQFGDRYRAYQQKVPKILPWQRAHQSEFVRPQNLFSILEEPFEV
ncbi:MAG: isoprenylcysteine carboxylmethyltransferase family protein [Bacteroidota bacterium]